MKEQPELIKTSCGYYTYRPLPDQAELNRYYAEKYYQQGLGSYSVTYAAEEKRYFQLKARLIYRKTAQILDLAKHRNMLDVGCGEGWLLNEFHQHGHTVKGLDFSRHGIASFHPHLAPFFEQGNLYGLLDGEIKDQRQYDVIAIANVVEHVVDPMGLMGDIARLMGERSVLVLVAPNDFSRLHEHLLAEKHIQRQFWLTYPDHLSYFNRESMIRMLNAKGLDVLAVVADNPIDLNLMNANTNYIHDPSKGKETHYFRCRQDLFLESISPDKLLRLYEILGDMGVGRDLTYYCKRKP